MTAKTIRIRYRIIEAVLGRPGQFTADNVVRAVLDKEPGLDGSEVRPFAHAELEAMAAAGQLTAETSVGFTLYANK